MEIKYRSVFDALKREIVGGKYSSHATFPSVAMLIRRFKISNLTAVKVLSQLKAMGLVCSYQGRGTFVTRQGASRKIGLIMPGVAYSTFFGPIVSEINRLAHENEYTLLLEEAYSLDAASRLDEARDLAASFVRQRVAGVIFQPLVETAGAEELNRRILLAFARARIPVVVLDGDIATAEGEMACDAVGIDDVGAGMRLADHLIEQGASRIHFLRHPFSEGCDPADDNRLCGVMTAVLRRGLRFDMKRSVLRSAPDDVAALKRHLRRERPDAFVCSNDSAAAIFLRTLTAVGAKVPKDVMLAGFGDLSIAALTSPPLTTIRQHTAEMARESFRLLLVRMGDPTLAPIKVSIAAPLVVRASTDCRCRSKGRGLKIRT